MRRPKGDARKGGKRPPEVYGSALLCKDWEAREALGAVRAQITRLVLGYD